MNSRRWPWPIAAAVVVALANAGALVGVWWNRLGPAEAELTVRPQEYAAVPDRRNEPPALGLHLVIREASPDFRPPGSPQPWLAPARLRALGIQLPSRRMGIRHSAEVIIPVFAAVENDGSAYADLVSRACAEVPVAHESDVNHHRTFPALCGTVQNGTRLIAMDVGTSVATLRARYPDRRRVAIVGARLVQRDDDEVMIYLNDVPIGVGGRWRERLRARSLPEPGNQPPAPTLVVAFGRSLEPWVVAVTDPAPTAPGP
jgi:hypothetical protein